LIYPQGQHLTGCFGISDKYLGKTRGTTTVMITPDPRILEMADRIIILEDGQIVSDKLQ
jgi:putative ABC transport system ATP-binding protein